MSTQPTSNRDFVRNLLPWIVAAAAFVLYAVTLNRWVTLSSLGQTALLGQWDWRPSYVAPLHYLLTCPIRFLPDSLHAIGLNAFAMGCGVLTLALLARSVALLPQDRTREQRQRASHGHLVIPLAWVPPVLAAGALGLQLTFWENAIAGTGEMLNLLVFAYVIRCLIEFRASRNERWLAKLALVYGLGIANNWTMIGFFPLFLVALVWILGRNFFRFDFIARMTIFGVAGLSLYLLLPAIEAFSSTGHATFWEVLRENLRQQKLYLWDAKILRNRVLWVSLTSILPILIMAFRWPSTFREISAFGSMLTNLMFRVVHLALLAICLWIFFDPPFSGRALGFGIPFLPFYYLTALAVGYFSGYVLLVFGKESKKAWERPSPGLQLLNRSIALAVPVVMAGVCAALLYNNFRLVRVPGSLAKQYADDLTAHLPAEGAIILSDDLHRLLLLKAAYVRDGKRGGNLLVDTASLPFSRYHEFLHEEYPGFASVLPKLDDLPAKLEDSQLLYLVGYLSTKHDVYYAHPSFGYYFEWFYSIPAGPARKLVLFSSDEIRPPAIPAEVMERNDAYWARFNENDPLNISAWAEKLPDAQFFTASYSLLANDWGVILQQHQRLDEAAEQFELAATLNPENLAAQLNRQFNRALQQGQVRPISPDEQFLKRIASWQIASRQFGRFDEPNACFALGIAFAQGGNLRQAAHYFLRVLDWLPESIEAQIALAKTYLDMKKADESLKLIAEIRAAHAGDSQLALHEFDLIRAEALALLGKEQTDDAEKLLLNDIARFGKDAKRWAFLAQFYHSSGRIDKAIESLDRQLALSPDHRDALSYKASLHMLHQRYDEAIPVLDRILQAAPDDAHARMNRAISHLQAGHLDLAERDYQELEKLGYEPRFRVYFGLGEIAFRKNNSAEALRRYSDYLKHGPRQTDEYRQIEERIAQLKGGR